MQVDVNQYFSVDLRPWLLVTPNEYDRHNVWILSRSTSVSFSSAVRVFSTELNLAEPRLDANSNKFTQILPRVDESNQREVWKNAVSSLSHQTKTSG